MKRTRERHPTVPREPLSAHIIVVEEFRVLPGYGNGAVFVEVTDQRRRCHPLRIADFAPGEYARLAPGTHLRISENGKSTEIRLLSPEQLPLFG